MNVEDAAAVQVSQSEKIKSRLDELLSALLGENNVEAWWHSANRAFEHRKPIDVFNDGRDGERRVVKYLLAAASGDYY